MLLKCCTEKWRKMLVAQSCPTVCNPMDQAPLSIEFSRQEYWSGLPFPSPGDLPDPGIEPRSPALQADSLLSSYQGSPFNTSANLENLAMATGLEKISFRSNPKEEQCQRKFKLPYNCTHFTCLLWLCSKSFKLSFNSRRIKNFQMYRLGFSKAEESEIKLPTFVES